MAKVLFIQDSWYGKLAIMQLSAILKIHGHQTDLIIAPRLDHQTLTAIQDFNPDIIAFSVLTTEQKWVKQIARELKREGVAALVIAGGAHPTFFPDFIHNEGIDAINLGEGDHSIVELANRIDENQDITTVQNLIVKKDSRTYKNPLRPQADLEDLPLPDRDIYLKYDYFKNAEFFDFHVSMGCPFKCSYCFFHKWTDLYKNTPGMKPFRLKSVHRCIREIKDLTAKAKVPLVAYVDSTFNLNKPWMIEFLKAYQQHIQAPFTINLRADLIDEELIKAIADTGLCRFVRMGIEVGNEEMRKKILRKNISNAQIYKAADLLRKYNIRLVTYNMYCLPGETLQETFETIEMNQRIQPFSMSSLIFHPYPGLDITAYAIETGCLKEKDIQKLEEKRFNRLQSVLKQKDVKQIENLYKLSTPAIYYPGLFPIIKQVIKLPPNILFDLVAIYSRILSGMKIFDKSFIQMVRKFVIQGKTKLV